MIKYITGHRILFLWYILFSVLRVALGLLLPFVLSGIINSAVDRDLELLGRLLFGGIGLVAVSVGVSYLWGLICNKMKRMARDSVKRDLFRSVMDKNVLAFESKENAEYLSVFLQNLDVLETLYFDNLLQIPTTLLAFLAAVVTSVILEPLMLIVIVLLGTMTSVVVKAMAKKLEVATNHYTKSLSEYTGWISNALQCFRLIRTYAIADKMEEKHGEQSLSVEIAKQKSLDKRLAFQRINEFAGVTTTLIIMGVAAYFAISGSFSTGIVLAFGQIAGNIIGPIMSGSDILVSVKSAKSLEKKYTDFLSDSSRTEVEDSGTNRERKIAKSGDIRVEKLGFGYGDRKIFEGLSCTFRENRRHLIVGGNGSGKSTLLMLLMGQYGADYTGDILLAGESLREIETSSIAGVVSYVSQNVTLLNDTLRNNITLYQEYPEEELERVIEKCGLKELIERLPEGLETSAKDGGQNFSGGEKQKISMARALIRKKPILILDEISANMDPEAAEQIEHLVLSERERTVISISHKLPEGIREKYDSVLELNRDFR